MNTTRIRRRSGLTALASAALVTAFALGGCTSPTDEPSDEPTTAAATTAAAAETSEPPAEPAEPAKPDQLTINVYSGAFQTNMEEYVVKPFQEETGIKVNLVTTAPPLATLQAQGDNPEVDLFIAGDPQRLLAEQAGLLVEYDPAVVTNAADLFPVAQKSAYAVVINYASQGLVYDTTKLSTAPTSWFDLFDLDLPGQIIVRAPDAQNTVSWLSLMVYAETGAWPTSIDDYAGILERVKTELKPNLYAAASSSGDITNAMTTGAATLGVWQDSQVLAANANGTSLAYAPPKEGSIPVATMVAVTRTPNKYWAEKLMNYILDPEVQAGWAANGGYGPTNTKTVIDPELAEQITYGDAEVSALVQIPWAQIVPITTELIEAFNAAIAN
jgi:putative spermidine/putrescine transport system substrate-binding protein